MQPSASVVCRRRSTCQRNARHAPRNTLNSLNNRAGSAVTNRHTMLIGLSPSADSSTTDTAVRLRVLMRYCSKAETASTTAAPPSRYCGGSFCCLGEKVCAGLVVHQRCDQQ